jgi:hypothetical protein
MVKKVNNRVLIPVGRTRSKVMTIAWNAITHEAMERHGR